jgi:hypothetical protein
VKKLYYYRISEGQDETYSETIVIHEEQFDQGAFEEMVKEAMVDKPGKIDQVDIVKYLIGHYHFQVAYIEAAFHSTYIEEQ